MVRTSKHHTSSYPLSYCVEATLQKFGAATAAQQTVNQERTHTTQATKRETIKQNSCYFFSAFIRHKMCSRKV